jgi:hypothetical protein
VGGQTRRPALPRARRRIVKSSHRLGPALGARDADPCRLAVAAGTSLAAFEWRYAVVARRLALRRPLPRLRTAFLARRSRPTGMTVRRKDATRSVTPLLTERTREGGPNGRPLRSPVSNGTLPVRRCSERSSRDGRGRRLQGRSRPVEVCCRRSAGAPAVIIGCRSWRLTVDVGCPCRRRPAVARRRLRALRERSETVVG